MPDLVVGMPVSLAICRFTLSIPNALLSEFLVSKNRFTVHNLEQIQFIRKIF